MVNMEESPWFFPYEEPNWEHECPRQREDEYLGSVDRIKFIDTTFTLKDDEFIDIMEEQLEEVRKWEARRARL
jgi:DNA-binding transcriptional regulator YiaG